MDARALLGLIQSDTQMCRALEAVAALDLPDGWIAAGFVRNRAWDALHGYARPTPWADVDVVYFDPGDRRKTAERMLEARLAGLAPGVPFSVKNQARMHLRNGDPPYRDTADALAFWLETPTAVAVRLRAGRLELLAPHGLDDLVRMVARPTPAARASPQKMRHYRRRMAAKNWPARWPLVRVLDL